MSAAGIDLGISLWGKWEGVVTSSCDTGAKKEKGDFTYWIKTTVVAGNDQPIVRRVAQTQMRVCIFESVVSPEHQNL